MQDQSYSKRAVRGATFAVICIGVFYSAIFVMYLGVHVESYPNTIFNSVVYLYLPMAIWAFVIWFFWPSRLDNGRFKTLILPSVILGAGYGGYLLGAFTLEFGGTMKWESPIRNLISGFAFGAVGGVLTISPVALVILITYSRFLNKKAEV